MRNKFIILYFLAFVSPTLLADTIFIQSKNITLEKKSEVSIFKDEVVVTTSDNNTIKSDYAKYNKKLGFVELKDNIVAIDNKDNSIETNYAEYDEFKKILKSKGPTKIITSEKYIIEGSDIELNETEQYIRSEKKAIITDLDNNKIYLENFDYQSKENIFKSIGFTKVEDMKGNTYEFSQIYIDTKKKEIVGSDSKAFMNDESFKIDPKNKPRIFSNVMSMKEEKTIFSKSKFTICDYRKKDKCPPWSIQANQMMHDSKKKTIYYDNAIIKVYDLPIFYFPKLSHPDPTVKRRSGFLPPSFSDTKNLGFGVSIPYFFAVSEDKNFTATTRMYASENPLIIGEYNQALKGDASFLTDFGYTEGYKKTTDIKKSGDKSHFFSKFTKNFYGNNNSNNSLTITSQHVSNDKYLKLYKIKSNLVDHETETLENSLNFSHESENIFVGINASVYETLKEDYNDKYEYILPDITIDKQLFASENLGSLDFQSNYRIHNYDTNKFENFFVNDLNWKSNDILNNFGLKTQLLSNLKNINYETQNINEYKDHSTSEFFGAIGLLNELNLQKKINDSLQLLKPKFLLRYAPGSMRKQDSGSRLNPSKAFRMNRLDNINNFETGLSSTIGLEYKRKKNKKEFDFSIAQIINEKENKKMPTKMGADEKLSDLVGNAKYSINDNLSFNYNFSIDQNYNELNYNEIGTNLELGLFNFDISYLEERKHIGDKNYFTTKVDYNNNKSNISFETKRDLVKDSAEFYNLSYEYINDCLRAGLVYRREFYTDSELEQENSLMFKITLTPFGNINSPKLGQ